MMNSIFLALAVVLTISASGSALKCDVCAYALNMPASKQVCNTIDCPVGNCFKLTYTAADGTDFVETGCDVLNYCSDISKVCTDRTKQFGLSSCQSSCCKTDNCNVVSVRPSTHAPSKGGKDSKVSKSTPFPRWTLTQVTGKGGTDVPRSTPPSKGGKDNKGSALICNKCFYTTKNPEEQKCDDSTLSCSTGYYYCGALTATLKNGTTYVARGCAGADFCPDGDPKACDELSKLFDVKSCAAACCNTNKCNNFTPSSATGIMATKFALIVMIIAGYLVV